MKSFFMSLSVLCFVTVLGGSILSPSPENNVNRSLASYQEQPPLNHQEAIERIIEAEEIFEELKAKKKTIHRQLKRQPSAVNMASKIKTNHIPNYWEIEKNLMAIEEQLLIYLSHHNDKVIEEKMAKLSLKIDQEKFAYTRMNIEKKHKAFLEKQKKHQALVSELGL